MKLGAEEKRKRQYLMILGPIAGLLFIYQLWNLFGGGGSAPLSPVVASAPANTVGPAKAGSNAGPSAAHVNTTSAQLDPTLHMEPMLVAEGLVYSGSGRNIFSGQVEAPPVEIAKVVAPPRPGPPVAPPQPPRPPGPPPLPPINLKFFGTDTAQNGSRRAFLLNGDDVFLASIGDVVQRRYRVVSIAATSIQVEDIPNNNKQTLPLVGN